MPPPPEPPDPPATAAPRPAGPDDLRGSRHRQAIGLIGFFLPILILGVSWLRPIPETRPFRVMISLSEYYYSGSVAIFTGMLFTLAVFLFSYRGYRDHRRWVDRTAAIAAGVAALGVAFFPMAPPASVPAPAWWSPWMEHIHNMFAVVLFGSFALFSLWPFRMATPGERRTRGKRIRNHIYLACGVIIAGAGAWAGFAGLHRVSQVAPESIALGAFSVSWLVKGRLDRTLAGLFRRGRRGDRRSL